MTFRTVLSKYFVQKFKKKCNYVIRRLLIGSNGSVKNHQRARISAATLKSLYPPTAQYPSIIPTQHLIKENHTRVVHTASR